MFFLLRLSSLIYAFNSLVVPVFLLIYKGIICDSCYRVKTIFLQKMPPSYTVYIGLIFYVL